MNNQVWWIKQRIKDFEETISNEKEEMKIIKKIYRNKIDELESNISSLGEQRREWKDKLIELEEVK